MLKTLDIKKNWKKLFLAFFFLNFLILVIPSRASAKDFSLGIYPPIFQIVVTPPVAIKKDFTIVNASENPQDVKIIFKPFRQGPYSNGQPQYTDTDTINGVDKNILEKIQILDGENPVTNLTLSPKQKKDLTMHIGLPKEEESSDYYFSIIFISNNPNTPSNTGSTLISGIAMNVLLSISPTKSTTGFLQEFSSPWFIQTGPVPFTVSIANTSNHYISPTGHILIRNMFGQLIGNQDLLPVNILANSTRFIPSKGNPVSRDLITHAVVLWNEKALFGPYRANIVVSLSENGPIFTKSIYFFAMPISYIIGGLLAVIIISIVVGKVRRKIRSN